MKKLLAVLGILVCCIGGYVWAESVTTTDGKNFNVTNDSGFTSVMTNNAIMQEVNSSALKAQSDSVTYLASSEVAYSWAGTELLAQNALANYNATSNQVNGS